MINKKIAMSGMSILTSLALMAGATFAVFTSEASNNGNTFSSGTLVLTINGSGGSSSTPAFAVTAAKPGDSTDKAITLANSGTVTASSVKLTSIGISGANTDLANVLTLTLFDDADSDGVLDGGETVLNTAHLNHPSWSNYTLPSVTIPGSGSFNLGARLTFDSDANSTYQGKSMNFNLNFQASQ